MGMATSFNMKLVKLLDGKSLSYALVVCNNSRRTVKIPDFLTGKNKIQIKFPDGKTFTYFDKNKELNYFDLAPGQSKFIAIDLAEILKNNPEFSMKNFDYGRSFLSWTIDTPKALAKRSFVVLFKPEKEFPEVARTKGYITDLTTTASK